MGFFLLPAFCFPLPVSCFPYEHVVSWLDGHSRRTHGDGDDESDEDDSAAGPSVDAVSEQAAKRSKVVVNNKLTKVHGSNSPVNLKLPANVLMLP